MGDKEMTATKQVEFRAKRNAFIKRSFRDTADRDYISARILHRNRLVEQFLWQALQCIEKYLKAILLFNNKGTKHLNHNISQALNDALSIEGLGVTVTKRTSDFVDSINEEGPNRYFSYPRFARGKEFRNLHLLSE